MAVIAQVAKPTKIGIVRLSSMRTGGVSHPVDATPMAAVPPAMVRLAASVTHRSTSTAIATLAPKNASEPSKMRWRAMRRWRTGLVPFGQRAAYTPMSSFHSAGCAAMKSSISLMHSRSSRIVNATPRARRYASGPWNVVFSPMTTRRIL